MFPIIAVDISGRHKTAQNDYYMVCAAVNVDIDPFGLFKVNEIRTESFCSKKSPDVLFIIQMIEKTILPIKKKGAVIIIERGDLFNMSEYECSLLFSEKVRFQSSVGERRAIEIAHHVSLSARRLVLKEISRLGFEHVC